TLFLTGCFASKETPIEVETIVEPPRALSPISIIVVDNSLPDPILVPYASWPEAEFQSATLEKTKLRGKQGMGIGVLPGAYLYGGRNAKGDLFSLTLALAGALAGGITGSGIGFVEGGTKDLIEIAVRIRDDMYTKDDIQEVYRALNTRELLVEWLQ